MPEDLQTIRRRKGMTVKQLASRSGISIATVIEYERGEKRISPTDVRRLANALYVEEWDINPLSSPPPPPPPAPREARPPRPPQPKKVQPKVAPPNEKQPGRTSPPARETQIAHLLTLAARLGIGQVALEAQIGKPLNELTRQEARQWNGQFMRRVAEERQSIDRKRAYLPEGVDGFELAYLQKQQEANAPLHFTLFDGQTFEGAVVGFSPYQITIRAVGGDEITLNKLAIAYYRKAGGGT